MISYQNIYMYLCNGICKNTSYAMGVYAKFLLMYLKKAQGGEISTASEIYCFPARFQSFLVLQVKCPIKMILKHPFY